MKSVLLFLISCAAFSSCAPVTPHLPIETSRHARGIKDSLFKKDKETKKELQALSHVPWGMYPLWKVHKYKGISIRPVPIGEVGVPVPAPMPSYQPQSSAGYSSPVAYDTLQSYKDHSPAAYQQPKNYQPQAGYGLVGYGEAQTKPIQHPSYRAPTQTPAAVPQMVNTYPNPAQLVYQSIPQQQHLYSQAQPIGQQATYGAANQNPSQQSYAPVQQLPQPSTSDSALQQAALLQKQHADALRTQQAAALRQQAAIAQQGQSGQQVHGQNTRPVISQQQAALDQQEQMMALQHQAALDQQEQMMALQHQAALAQQQALLAQQQATAVQQGDAAQQDIAGKHGYAQTTNQRPIEQPQFVQQDQLRPSLLAQQQDAMAQRGEAGQQGYVQITNPRPIQQPNFFQQDQLQGQQAPLREPATVAPPFSELPEDFPRELDFTVPSGSIAPADHGSLPLEGEEEEEEDQWSPFEHNSGEDHTNWQEEPRNTRAWNK